MLSTYEISSQFIKLTKQNYLLMMILFPIGMILTVLFMGLIMPSIFLQILFYEVTLIIGSRIMISKVSKKTLMLYEDKFQHNSGMLVDNIFFSNISSVIVQKNKDSTINKIKITYNSKNISLLGFSNLDEILEVIKSKSTNATFNEKTYKINNASPLLYIIPFLLTVILINVLMLCAKN